MHIHTHICTHINMHAHTHHLLFYFKFLPLVPLQIAEDFMNCSGLWYPQEWHNLRHFECFFFFTFLGCFRLTQQWYQAVQQIVTQVQRRRNAPKIGRGARSLRYLVHRKFRVKKGTFKYCLPQKWGVHVPPQFLRLCMCDDRAAISTATQFVSYLTNFNSLQGVTRKLSQMVKHRSAAQCAWCLVQLASFAI